MVQRQQRIDPAVLHLTTAVATVAALLVAVLVPVLHYHFGSRYHAGSVAEKAAVHGQQLSQMIARNPQWWEFETPRIEGLLTDRAQPEFEEHRSVRGRRGNPITEVGSGPLAWPVVRHEVALFDAGQPAGGLEVARSLRPLLGQSLRIFALSALAGGVIFVALRTLPLRILRRAIDHAAFLASHDPLTGLPNRALFGERLADTIAEAAQDGAPAAILCLDLDRFKEVNDALGHVAGDELLVQVTMRLAGALRADDVLARLGGDEFAVIQRRSAQPDGATRLAGRLVGLLAEPFHISGHEVTIGVSIGICLCEPGAGLHASGVMQRADLALYRAKSEGRSTFRVFEEEMNRRLIERRALEADLRRAIAEGQFELHYQPQINLRTDAVTGVEALLRWPHPTRGWIPPDRFIPLAEETGLIVPLGTWIIHAVCQQALVWPGLTFAVNVSPVQFRRGNLLEAVRTAIADTGMQPERLEIEITEGVLLHNTEDVLAILAGLKALGVRIAMDDFGTGYSSLGYLRRFPFDKIKIDRSFIADLGRDGQADSIIDAVIGLGRSLGMTLNAEGVETREQATLLRHRACDEVQGYYFARPMSGRDLDATLACRPSDSTLHLRSPAERARAST